jgi:nicotinate-nucleotide pyrophosphorylase (carboxylating)
MSETLDLRSPAVRELVRRALEEDAPWGDVTTVGLIPASALAHGRFVANEGGIVAGLTVAAMVFEELDPAVSFSACVPDGSRITPGAALAEIRGPARPILTGERVALNLVQRMSGIASATARFVEAVDDTGATIVDTRKTAPGLRLLDKYAVRCGGGANHRFSLSDGVLVKDNHLSLLGDSDVSKALRVLRTSVPHILRVEVEVDRIDQIEAALAAGAGDILLDNMSPDELRRAVDLIGGRALTEASGGISLDTVRAVAESGVDLISVGSLTHSVRALDISLELYPVKESQI